MAVSGTGDWPLRSPRANRQPLHRKQLTFGLENIRSTLVVDLFFGSTAGPTVYNENMAETVALSEALANLGIFSPGVAESVALAEAIGNLAIYAPSLAETVTLSEDVSAAAVFAAGLAEAVALVEALAEGMVYTEGLAEAVALAEALLEQLLRGYQTPYERTLYPVVEDRVLALLYRVVEVLRTMTTALETRTLTVQAQTRTADTLSEGRTLTVGAESRTELAEGE